MSIYYNLSKTSIRNEKEEMKFDSDEGNELLLSNQADYQVGVARFKIPINTIPLYRIYQNELHLNLISSLGNKPIPAVIANNRAYLNGSIFGFDVNDSPAKTNQIFTNKGIYGLDKHRVNTPFIDIFSNAQFVELMNNAIAKQFSYLESCRLNVPATPSRFSYSSSNASAQNAGTALNKFITKLPFVGNVGGVQMTELIVPADASPVPEKRGIIMTGFELNVKRFNMVQGNAPALQIPYPNGDFSDLSFYLCKGDVNETDLITGGNVYPLIQNILKGVNKMDETKPQEGISLSLKNGYDIDAQSQLYNDLFEANLHRGTEPFRMYPSATDFTGLYGQRIDSVGTEANSWTSASQEWSILVVNSTYAKNVAVGDRIPYWMSALAVEVKMEGSYLNNFDVDTLRQKIVANSSNPTYKHSLPQFKYDNNINKIYFERASWWDNSYGLKIHMNNALKSLMSFGEYEIKEFKQEDFSRFFPKTSVLFTDNKKGHILNFPSRIQSLGVDESLGGADGSSEFDNYTPISHYEAFDTRFARSFVDSLILTSGSIATQGEVVGNGASIRKVITDFVLDPSVNFRDYIVLEPTTIRYYPLVANHPLYKVDVEVAFKDILGIVRPLFIDPSMVASIKVEFRPNNMVQNYQ